MQGGLNYERNVCPSVRPSVKRVDCDKTKQSFAQIFIPHERTFTLVFRQEERLVGTAPCT